MKYKIIIYVILMALIVNTVNAEKYFVLDVNYIIGYVTFNSISLKEISRSIKNTDTAGFLVKTVSFENTDIKILYYNMSENKNYLIYIPYNENAARIEMYNLNNSKVMDVDVSSFSNTCGNNICEAHESYESCTKDCHSGSKDDFCDGVNDGICDPDCSPKTDIDCTESSSERTNVTTNISVTAVELKKQQSIIKPKEEQKRNTNYLLWVSLIFIIILSVLLTVFIKKRMENQVIDSLKQYITENIKKGFSLQQIKNTLFKEGYTENEVDKAIKSI